MKHLLLTMLFLITTPAQATDIISAARCQIEVAQTMKPGTKEQKAAMEACYSGNANIKHAIESLSQPSSSSVTINVETEVRLNGAQAPQGVQQYPSTEPYTANQRARLYPYSYGPAIRPKQ